MSTPAETDKFEFDFFPPEDRVKLTEISERETMRRFSRFEHLLVRGQDETVIAGCTGSDLVAIYHAILQAHPDELSGGDYVFRLAPTTVKTIEGYHERFGREGNAFSRSR